jgi:RNA polymerase sigma-70 factor (ECF subfamily)
MGIQLTSAEESELLSDLRAGRAEAFERLVREFGPPMRAVTRRMLRNDEDADDALQEAFVAAFKAVARFEGRSSLATWLHRIAVNAALMKLRGKHSRAAEEAAQGELRGEIDELLPGFVGLGVFREPQSRWCELPEDPLVREELCATVRAAIDGLPEPFRAALLLRDIEGLSNEELAAALGVSVNAAKIRVHRGRQALRALLEPRIRALEA